MIDLLTSAAGGGLIGMVGSAVSSVVGIFKAKQEQAHKLKLLEIEARIEADQREFDLKQIDKELEAMDRRHAYELEKSTIDAETKALTGSYQHDMAVVDTQDSKLLIVAEFLRKTARPLLTYILLLLVGLVYWSTDDVVLQTYITEGVTMLASTAVAWWFADRTVAKRVIAK